MRRRKMDGRWLVLGSLALLACSSATAGCGGDDSTIGTGEDGGGDGSPSPVDGGHPQADATVKDSSVADSTTPDSNVADSNVPDSTTKDANVGDTGVADASDAGGGDASDANAPDAAVSDSGLTCAVDNDCIALGAGNICIGSQCVPGNCHTYADCSNNAICNASHQCASCTGGVGSTDCAGNAGAPNCVQGQCIAGNCLTSTDCTGTKAGQSAAKADRTPAGSARPTCSAPVIRLTPHRRSAATRERRRAHVSRATRARRRRRPRARTPLTSVAAPPPPGRAFQAHAVRRTVSRAPARAVRRARETSARSARFRRQHLPRGPHQDGERRDGQLRVRV